VDLSSPEALPVGSCILVGIIKTVKTITTSKGVKMAFATLSDYNGEIEVTFFSDAWGRCQDKIEADKVAMLKGKIEYQKDKDRRSFIADDWVSMNEADETVREEEARSRKWDKYRNIRIYARELDLRMLDLAAPGKEEAGTYTIVGLIKSLRTHTDKKGNDMAFGTLQDDRGEIDLVFFSRTWEKCKAVAEVDGILALKGTIDPAKDRNPEKPGFVVSSIQDINKLIRMSAKAAEEAAKKEAEKADGPKEGTEEETALPEKREVHIRLNQETAEREENLYPLRDYLFGHSGPCSVFIHVPASAGETVIRTATQISTSPEPAALEALTLCTGVAEVWRE
jgi:DNA polymerase-3 subunit alpha